MPVIWAARPRSGGKAALPPVSVVYVGALKTLAALEPRISAGALERELAVRKMENEVEQLERLRKLDEERRIERQKALEAERLRGAPVQSSPAPAPIVGNCRDYRGDATIDGQGTPFYGRACLGRDGRWHIVSQN